MAVRSWSWLRNLFAPRPVRKAPARWRPAVEALEAREVPSAPVITSYTVPTSGTEGTPLAVSAQAYDPEGYTSTLAYNWVVLNQDGTLHTTHQGAAPPYVYTDSGNYRVGLTVSDQAGEKAVGPYPTYQGLAGWWSGETGATGYWNFNHGTLAGGVTSSPGKLGKGFDFNGTGRMTVADAPSLDLTYAVTMEAWVKPSAMTFNNNFGAVIAKSDNTVRNYGLFVRSNGAIHLSYVTAAGANVILETPPNLIAAGQFAHVAAVVDTNTQVMRIYVNGNVVAGRATAGVMATNAAPLTVGNADSAYNYGFKGVIDEPAVYYRALGEAEVRSIYTAGTVGNSAKMFSSVAVANVAPTVWQSMVWQAGVGQEIFHTFGADDQLQGEEMAGFRFTLDWGDGSPVETFERTPENGHGIIRSHRYTTPGTYHVTVTATDRDGGVGVGIDTIEIV